jgi:magnesium-transporting ATPase (P-type)
VLRSEGAPRDATGPSGVGRSARLYRCYWWHWNWGCRCCLFFETCSTRYEYYFYNYHYAACCFEGTLREACSAPWCFLCAALMMHFSKRLFLSFPSFDGKTFDRKSPIAKPGATNSVTFWSWCVYNVSFFSSLSVVAFYLWLSVSSYASQMTWAVCVVLCVTVRSSSVCPINRRSIRSRMYVVRSQTPN